MPKSMSKLLQQVAALPAEKPPTDGWVLENGFELHLSGSIFRFADMDSLQQCSRFIQQQEENWKIAIRKTLATQKKELLEKVEKHTSEEEIGSRAYYREKYEYLLALLTQADR